jgi:hypothetical protein
MRHRDNEMTWLSLSSVLALGVSRRACLELTVFGQPVQVGEDVSDVLVVEGEGMGVDA